MQLTINGEAHILDIAPPSVTELINYLRLDTRKIAIECNCEIIPKSTYDNRVLNEGDTIEIVGFIGGG